MHELLAFLHAHGADQIPHPGGTLLAHLQRTSDRLRDWDADDALQTLGLAHATYGTYGFDQRLLSLDERPALAAIVGTEVEAQVYLYASCDRRRTYGGLDQRPDVMFTDRFTGEERLVRATDLRSFAELTAANELDVALNTPGFTSDDRAELLALLDMVADLLSPSARSQTRSLLGPGGETPPT